VKRGEMNLSDPLLTVYLIFALINSEDGGRMYFRNVGIHIILHGVTVKKTTI
jgi:hypothetical protein